MPRTKGRGRLQQTRVETTPPPKSDVDSDSQSVQSVQQPSPVKSKNTKLVRSDLSDQDEESMVDFLRENPILFNKKLSLYNDKVKKDAMWNEQAKQLEKDVNVLRVWYRSIRTRYGKLTKQKSGAGGGEFTERDKWILERFHFLQGHIYKVQPRTIVSLKEQLSAQNQADEDTASIGTDDVQPVSSISTDNNVVLDVRPKRSSSRLDDERILNALDERGRQSIQLQEKLFELVKPPAPTSERTTLGDCAKSVMIDLDPSLWRHFQQEQSQLLYKYLDLNDKGHVQQPWPPQQTKDQQRPTTVSQQHSSSAQWQLEPKNWPTRVDTTSVWISMTSTWVQAQMNKEPCLTTLQPRSQSTTQNTSPSAVGATSVSPDSQEVSFSGFSNSFDELLTTGRCDSSK